MNIKNRYMLNAFEVSDRFSSGRYAALKRHYCQIVGDNTDLPFSSSVNEPLSVSQCL